MSSAQKIIQAAAGNAAGAGTYVEDVFSTYLYDGTGSAQTITNGIDLDGEGGMVWGKVRDIVDGHWLVDSERGTGTNSNFKYLRSDTTSTELDLASRSLSSFNSDGFTFQAGDSQFNASGNEYCSWTFRKAPKFFDVVTYTGNSVAGRTVSHNLGSVPGCIIVKSTSNSYDWAVYHRGTDASSPQNYSLRLNSTEFRSEPNSWNNTAPTSTEFSLGSASDINLDGGSFVAYLFAHNNGDGEFGEDADQDIIKCGSYTGNGGTQDIDVGFEPQWVMIKNADNTSNWVIVDVMRGFIVDSSADSTTLQPNTSNAESSSTAGRIGPRPNGFGFISEGGNDLNANYDYIYIAIRRGPMKTPEDAGDLFAPARNVLNVSPTFYSGWPVDFGIARYMLQGFGSSNKNYAYSRLTGTGQLQTYSNASEVQAGAPAIGFDSMVGAGLDISFEEETNAGLAYMFRRAPGFFDVVAYEGNGTAGRTLDHNLGVVPEMMWIKARTVAEQWVVYHKGLNGGTTPENYHLHLNGSDAEATALRFFNNTAPASTVFTLGDDGGVNRSGDDYVAHLFASLDGISKVGSYSGTSALQVVDCGFSAGARFVIIKRIDAGSSWYVWDTERGIVTGNDPYIILNESIAETTDDDFIDPNSSGFELSASSSLNVTGREYIFLAIA